MQDWSESLAFGDGATTVPVIPIGIFDTQKYGKLPLTKERAQRILDNFKKGVLKTDVMVDVDHEMGKSAGWLRDLRLDTFPHAVTGEPIEGLVADVEWTPFGGELTDNKEYRYLSATIAPYHDEETGEDHTDVLRSVSLTNKPVMKMMPAIATSEVEITYYNGDTPVGHDTTSIANPALVVEFSESIYEEPPAPVEEPPVEVAGDAVTPVAQEGGISMSEVELAEKLTLAEQRAADAEARLAETLKKAKEDKVAATLDALSEKGMTEPARVKLSAILLAEGDTIELGEGEVVDKTDALIELANELLDTKVPVEGTELQPAEEGGEEDELTPERREIRKQLRVE